MLTRAMEHCDDTVMEHCDEKNSGALCCQVSWRILMSRTMEPCDDRGHDKGMEDCDDR